MEFHRGRIREVASALARRPNRVFRSNGLAGQTRRSLRMTRHVEEESRCPRSARGLQGGSDLFPPNVGPPHRRGRVRLACCPGVLHPEPRRAAAPPADPADPIVVPNASRCVILRRSRTHAHDRLKRSEPRWPSFSRIVLIPRSPVRGYLLRQRVILMPFTTLKLIITTSTVSGRNRDTNHFLGFASDEFARPGARTRRWSRIVGTHDEARRFPGSRRHPLNGHLLTGRGEAKIAHPRKRHRENE